MQVERGRKSELSEEKDKLLRRVQAPWRKQGRLGNERSLPRLRVRTREDVFV